MEQREAAQIAAAMEQSKAGQIAAAMEQGVAEQIAAAIVQSNDQSAISQSHELVSQSVNLSICRKTIQSIQSVCAVRPRPVTPSGCRSATRTVYHSTLTPCVANSLDQAI